MATQVKTPTFAELKKNAQDLIPVLKGRAQQTSRERRVPKETIDDFWKAGLFDLLKPKKFGGKEMRYDDTYFLTIELARGDGSAAWVQGVIVVHELIIALFEEQAQKELWEDPRSLCASAFAPTGKAEPAPGGARVSGKWSFCSGIDNADWMVFGAFFGMTGTPPHPDIRFVLVRRSEGEVIDDWNVMGLQGTGSKSFTMNNVFVPEHRILSWGPFSMGTGPFGPGPGCPGTKVHPQMSLLKAPMWGVFPFCIAAPATGIARGVFESYIEQMRTRQTAISQEALSQFAHVHYKVAEAGALTDAAEFLYKRSLKETIDKVEAGETLTTEHRARSRRDQSQSIAMAKQAAEALFNATGGTGLYDSQHVQRGYRDLHAMSHHIVGAWEVGMGVYGKVMLGGQPSPTDFI